MERPSLRKPADGKRLDLHCGPIDLIVAIVGSGRKEAEFAAIKRFNSVLDELVVELPARRLQALP